MNRGLGLVSLLILAAIVGLIAVVSLRALDHDFNPATEGERKGKSTLDAIGEAEDVRDIINQHSINVGNEL